MADDDTGATSSPWGRTRRTPPPAPGGAPPPPGGTPAPPPADPTVADPYGAPGTPAPPYGTPAPPSGAPGTPAPPGPFAVPGTPAPPSNPFAAPGTPAPPPFSLDKAPADATTVSPAGQWAGPPTSPPGYGYGGTPPPGYPPGGYPPGGPVPAKKGKGAVIALVAVGVAALLLVGAVVALVALSGDDDDPDTASDRDTTSVSVPDDVPPSIDTPETPDSTETPASTEPPQTSDPTVTAPTIPGAGTSAPPEGFPDPPGARDSVTGGIEVPDTTAQEVADFYEDGLPGAGYTVDRVDDVGGIFVLTISGPDNGVLSITSFDPLPTTVLWTGL